MIGIYYINETDRKKRKKLGFITNQKDRSKTKRLKITKETKNQLEINTFKKN